MGYGNSKPFQGQQTYSGFQQSRFPDLEDNDNVEVWVTGEGEYNYLSYEPGYGDHGCEDETSHVDWDSPFVRYFILDNIKYAALFIVGYFLASHLASQNSAGAEAVFAMIIALSSPILIKSFVRYHRNK